MKNSVDEYEKFHSKFQLFSSVNFLYIIVACIIIENSAVALGFVIVRSKFSIYISTDNRFMCGVEQDMNA
jgi:hypothetical protein